VAQELEGVYRYHDGTKHHFNRFARSLGYLDWASQPHPFRRYAGADVFPIQPRPDAAGRAGDVGDLLRHSLGLSAWKRFRDSRWSLRVNPSSGNLHPTEAYVVCGPGQGLAPSPAVYHYAADRHELELRCEFDGEAWRALCQDADVVLVILTSIHWREAWKYGERAFRYCQHDLGHAIAAVAIAAEMTGYVAAMVPTWSNQRIARLAGLDRDEDYLEAEREEPGCLLALARGEVPRGIFDDRLSGAVAGGRWHGRANQLSEDHVQWTFIEEIAAATRDTGRAIGDEITQSTAPAAMPRRAAFALRASAPKGRGLSTVARRESTSEGGGPGASGKELTEPWKELVLRRRSAVALDGQSSTTREAFCDLLAAAMPDSGGPFDALWWTPRIHLALFVHRVTGVEPGLYMLVRDDSAFDALRAAAEREFLWERTDSQLPLFLLARGDCRRLACRVSCDQDIAADGFFSLGMIARFDASLDEFGPSFYRHLFWESGVVGQSLYLAAEAAGARATGIGCFYDDPVHDLLGLRGHAFQSLYHFTVGIPVEDSRLTTEPGYAWEPARPGTTSTA
jgi:SagB-type dehydrogenase family enzyme